MSYSDKETVSNPPASSPCMMDLAGLGPDDAPDEQAHRALTNSLVRVLGLNTDSARTSPETDLAAAAADLFQCIRVNPETTLEVHQSPWKQVYLVQYGILRLFRENAAGQVAIHHFFTEGDVAWPVFGRSRTARNTLCLTSVTHATLWVADFNKFRALLMEQSEGVWARFAWTLTEELAELTTMREFRKQTMTARERYQLLLEEYPELVRRVPDNQLASWLGVVPATFSRIKNSKQQGRK